MMLKPLLGAFSAVALLAACASEPPPPPRPATVAAPVIPAPAAPTGDGRVAAVRFDAASSVLTPMARAELGPVLDRLMANPGTPVRITSYSSREDMPMARERTQTIRMALTERGVSRGRIRVMNARLMPNADPDVVQVQVQGSAMPARSPRA
ncbi:hypothetical protein [Roseococcus sp.]|uniref:hypothetical protein n=1 Tax=Roseococcus sp. TaxID=2109646 RepID=UPI003BA8EDD1